MKNNLSASFTFAEMYLLLNTVEVDLLELDSVIFFGMEISLVSLFLLYCLESTVYTFLRL